MLFLLTMLSGLTGVGPIQAAERVADAHIELHCVPRAELLSRIKADDATPLFVGLSNNGLGLEVWHTPDELWVAFISRPDGIACIVSQGKQMGFANPPTQNGPDTQD